MKIKMFQVDAFSDKLFCGNPAAVCILKKNLDENLMQKIALENNLSETAYVLKKNNEYEIRWFTPKSEIDLCGHATLASAHVIFEYFIPNQKEITFISKYSGILKVKKEGEYLELNFPIGEYKKIIDPEEIINGLGKKPLESYKAKKDYMFIFEKQKDIENIKPDFQILRKTKAKTIIVTSKGDETDFVSRVFAPYYGINEDPVTGSAHTMLTPYWIKRLNKENLEALQISERKGYLKCRIVNDRVYISGKAKTFFIGDIIIPE